MSKEEELLLLIEEQMNPDLIYVNTFGDIEIFFREISERIISERYETICSLTRDSFPERTLKIYMTSQGRSYHIKSLFINKATLNMLDKLEEILWADEYKTRKGRIFFHTDKLREKRKIQLFEGIPGMREEAPFIYSAPLVPEKS